MSKIHGDNEGKNHVHKGHHLLGWFSDHNKAWYEQQASKIKNGIIVEIGVYGGVSILTIVDTCIKNNTTIYGIDPWEDLANFNGEEINEENKGEAHKVKNRLRGLRKKLEKIVSEFDYQDTIHLIQGWSEDEKIINRFEDNSVDLVFIDGNHSYESVLRDANNWYPKLKKGGILSGHDWQFRDIKKAARQFSLEHGKRLAQNANIWWTAK